VIVDGRVAARNLEKDDRVTVKVVFEVPEGVDPSELKYSPSFGLRSTVKYVFR